MIENYTIKDFHDVTYSFDDFLESVKWHSRMGYTVYIGTDSKVNKDKIFLVSVVCFHAPGTGGKVFSIKEHISRKLYPTLRARMLLEASRSLEIAMQLDPHVDGKLEIHLDVGDTIKSKTSAYEQELQSLVVSQGYVCEIKPNSWASSSVADRVTK
jgi:predicted RNase H-related nuclease YkuK (DUF458 family)